MLLGVGPMAKLTRLKIETFYIKHSPVAGIHNYRNTQFAGFEACQNFNVQTITLINQ